jgi:hypothetical protein
MKSGPILIPAGKLVVALDWDNRSDFFPDPLLGPRYEVSRTLARPHQYPGSSLRPIAIIQTVSPKPLLIYRWPEYEMVIEGEFRLSRHTHRAGFSGAIENFDAKVRRRQPVLSPRAVEILFADELHRKIREANQLVAKTRKLIK